MHSGICLLFCLFVCLFFILIWGGGGGYPPGSATLQLVILNLLPSSTPLGLFQRLSDSIPLFIFLLFLLPLSSALFPPFPLTVYHLSIPPPPLVSPPLPHFFTQFKVMYPKEEKKTEHLYQTTRDLLENFTKIMTESPYFQYPGASDTSHLAQATICNNIREGKEMAGQNMVAVS